LKFLTTLISHHGTERELRWSSEWIGIRDFWVVATFRTF